jgi:hypothetical protein
MDIVSLLGQLAQNGIMSVLFVISCFVCYRLFTLYLQTQNMLLEEKDKHRENVEKIANASNLASAAVQHSLEILAASQNGKKNNE